jgi:hypothetical protein
MLGHLVSNAFPDPARRLRPRSLFYWLWKFLAWR